jgi:N-acyl amino acid synthase of PEP-CTERM/exosortase system
MNGIEEAFHQYFEIVNADTPELYKEAFNLRYRVLCVHNIIPGFNRDSYPDELENDEYDNRSTHFLLRHRATQIYIGTARLILPDTQCPENKFPTELHTRFFPGFNLNSSSRRHTAEISRFVMNKEFFRRKNEHGLVPHSIDSKHDPRERRRFPHPMLGLAVGIIRLCAQHNIHYWLSSMDPALNRLLGFYSLQLNPIGPSVNYHGIRSPYHVCLFDVLDRIYQNHREIWELVTDHGKFWPADLTSLREEKPQFTRTDNARASR